MGARFSTPIKTGDGAHPASCTMSVCSFPGKKVIWGHAMAHVVSSQPFTTKAQIQSQAGPFWIYSRESDTMIGFSPSTSVFPCQYHSTIAPYSFIHLPPMLYNVFLPVLQFSPVSIIPLLLHTHSFIYHTHCTMFFSQYFSFTLSVSFQKMMYPNYLFYHQHNTLSN